MTCREQEWKQRSQVGISVVQGRGHGHLSLGRTADGDSSNEIKRRLLLGRKVVTNLDSIFKKRDHYFTNKGLSSQAMLFLVVMYGCEIWSIKHA